MGLDLATVNVIQLGVGFFFNFFAFNSQGFIEEPVIDSLADRGSIGKHSGYYSLSIIYAVFTLANFVAAPLVEILKPKWAMVIGGLCYAAFQAGFLWLNQTYLFISSGLLGFGAAILWTGQGTYLSQNCTEKTTGRNSAMLWALSQASLAGGGIFLFIVFHQSSTTDNISDSTVHLLYACFTILTLVAVFILALLRTPPKLDKPVQPIVGYGELMVSTFKLMLTKKMVLLAFVFAYTGVEQSFWTGIYPTCISFTQRLGKNTNSLLALNSIAAGLGSMLAGLLFGILGDRTRKIGRDSIVFLGCCIHLLVFVGVYINFPADASLHKTNATGIIEPNVILALICGGFLGFGDACWNTQIYSLLCDIYPTKSSQAFALFKFYQSALSCAAFFYSSMIYLTTHLAILVVTSLIAAVCYFGVERMAREIPEETSTPSSIVANLTDREYSEPFPEPPEDAQFGRTYL
ncbi:unnamed protein product [Auanema sp. JU1783]|nr:unnamed protein product [Auanema sp. JU1783]